MADAVAKREAAKLAVFTAFLGASSPTGHVGGLLGEWGIPQADSTAHPNAQYVTDVPSWQKVAEWVWTKIDDYNATNAPTRTLWVTTWASGPAWGEYNLGELVGDAPGPASKVRTPGMADVREAHPPQQSGPRHGTNAAGLEFGVSLDPAVGTGYSNAASGALNTDFWAPGSADAAYFAGRAVSVVRLPLAWERLQPTLLGALNTTYLGYVTTFVTACAAQGIGVILDLHNYARYAYDLGGGNRRILKLRRTSGLSTTADGNNEGRFGQEYLVDVWARLSDAYKSTAAVVGYDLMNEPHDLDAESGTFSGTAMYAWATTTQSWAGGDGNTTLTFDGAQGHTATGALKVVKATSAFTNVRADDAAQKLNDPGSGLVLSFWLKLDAGDPAGTYTAKAQWQTSGFVWQDPASVAYFDAAGAGIANPVRGSWCEVRSTFSAITSPNAYCVQVDCPSTTTLTLWIDDFVRGSVSGASTAAGVWELITQAVVTDLRTTKSDPKCVVVPGYGWNVAGWPHAAPWIVEPGGGGGTHRYATHLYHDPDDSGDYDTGTETYTATHTAATGAGYSDDADTTAPTISGVTVT